MAKRTLSSCWKQFEKLASEYRAAAAEQHPPVTKRALALVEKANTDHIGANTLLPLFVKPYIVAPVSLEFTAELDERGELPAWHTRYDAEKTIIHIQPLAVLCFFQELQAAKAAKNGEADFLIVRYRSFLREIAKLPSIYFLFLVVLQRVAEMLEIAHLEKRGGVIEVAEGESYHTLLWAFKELEVFVRRTYGVNVRAHYGISWYEADWITGR